METMKDRVPMSWMKMVRRSPLPHHPNEKQEEKTDTKNVVLAVNSLQNPSKKVTQSQICSKSPKHAPKQGKIATHQKANNHPARSKRPYRAISKIYSNYWEVLQLHSSEMALWGTYFPS
jgi:hypothetical protein